MTFGLLSVFGVLAGLAALAGVLFALQRLRVRHREVTVVTTLFWHEAVEEARARMLTGRFRHPWAYAFVLLICALLWTAFAEPRYDAGDGRDHVVVVDGSARMGLPGRFDAARDAVESVVSGLPATRTTVVFAGGTPRTLLRPDEDRHLLRTRLAALAPEACPPQVLNVIRELYPTASNQRPLTVHVIGDADLSALGTLPEWVQVGRAHGGASPLAGNRGIVSMGLADAASGAYDRVDVMVEVAGSGVDSSSVTVTQGARLAATQETRTADKRLRLLFADLPANGTPVKAQLEGDDALAADDSAQLSIPLRPLIRVRLVGAAAERLRSVLLADAAVMLVESEADVLVGDGDGSAPVLGLVSATDQTDAILVQYDAPQEGAAQSVDEVLVETFRALALSEIDATSLAETARREIRLGVRPGSVRGVFIWESLITERFDLVHSRAFPVLVARAIRWLADAPDLIPYVVAGQPLLHGRPGYTPPAAGAFDTGDGSVLSVSLADPDTTRGWSGPDALPAASGGGAGSRLATVLVLLAFALLAVEWFAYRTGRMP